MKKVIICKDLWGKVHKTKASEMYFRPSVYGVIIKNGKVLLSRQHGKYDFPGGGIEIGESIDQALGREVKEETGLTVRRGPVLISETSNFYSIISKEPYQAIITYYLCTVAKGKISTKYLEKTERDYIAEAEWVPLKDIQKITFINNTVPGASVIKQALRSLNK